MSVIIVALIATSTWSNLISNLQSFDLQIGGLNASEFNDLKILALPSEPSVREAFGAWSANWVVESPLPANDRMRLLASPPLKHAAPFLSRIKTWGYHITFYQSYQEKQEIFRESCVSTEMTPSLVHSWILEKESDQAILPPPPPTSPSPSSSITTTTENVSSTETSTISITTSSVPSTQNTSPISPSTSASSSASCNWPSNIPLFVIMFIALIRL